ncbi:MAG: phosphoribosylglycinamide formyltransferase [Boseongicola sp.]|nr:phosphoribosylglycinamide formyltransferase [Boseongicola sp.]
MTRVAILISGGGSNMVALVKHMQDNGYAEPVSVLSNDPKAKGLERASALGVPTEFVDHRVYKGHREKFETALNQALVKCSPDIICLAGFMRILTPNFVNTWQDKILNIHPSLLPKYPGLNTHQRAIDAGDVEAGCTVHRVTAELDSGPMLGQARVPVKKNDTAETLASRVLTMEHKLYPQVLQRFVAGERAPIFLSYT